MQRLCRNTFQQADLFADGTGRYKQPLGRSSQAAVFGHGIKMAQGGQRQMANGFQMVNFQAADNSI